MEDVVHLVISPHFVHGAYWRRDIAERHERCVTGAKVVSVEVRNDLPPEIQIDLAVDSGGTDDFDGDTPVIDVSDLDDQEKK